MLWESAYSAFFSFFVFVLFVRSCVFVELVGWKQLVQRDAMSYCLRSCLLVVTFYGPVQIRGGEVVLLRCVAVQGRLVRSMGSRLDRDAKVKRVSVNRRSINGFMFDM